MKRAGLKCKPSKCEILRASIKYRGRMVDRHGVGPDPEAVEAVLTWKAPRTDTQLMSFLGFANYFLGFASARHAYREGHVCSSHRRISSSYLRNTASGAGIE